MLNDETSFYCLVGLVACDLRSDENIEQFVSDGIPYEALLRLRDAAMSVYMLSKQSKTIQRLKPECPTS